MTYMTGKAFYTQFHIWKINILSYNSLISAIPSAWKKTIKNAPIELNAIHYDELPHFETNGLIVPVTLITNKSVYWKLVKEITQPPISQIAWNRIFNEEHDNWAHIFKVPYKVTPKYNLSSIK